VSLEESDVISHLTVRFSELFLKPEYAQRAQYFCIPLSKPASH
jgi:hypothetical protein